MKEVNMATDPEIQKQIDDLKQQTEKLNAQKQKLDAEKAVNDSQEALAQSQKDSSVLNQLRDQKALADAQKALADSQKALADAQTQALLAQLIGDVKTGPFTGSVDLRDKAGTQEAALLAARAVQRAAAAIAAAVPEEVKDISIFASKDFPNFQKLLGFRFRKELLKQAFQAVGIARLMAGAEAEAVAIPALISGGLDAFSKLLDFFKTDFATGGVDVKLDESLLLFAVAGRLSRKNARLPLIYNPAGNIEAMAGVTKQLAELADLRARTASQVTAANAEIDAKTKELADPAQAARKDILTQEIAAGKARVEALNGAIALYDGFVNGLTTPDSNGVVPIALLAQEFDMDATFAAGGAILLLRLESAGGGFLVKKNLLTGLGSMPLFHSGGATVTYLLLDGKEGRVLKGDVVPVHGGFVASNKMEATLNAPINSADVKPADK
jgi:hypothetical protein